MGVRAGFGPRPAGRQNGRVITESDAARIARRYPPRRLPRWAWIPVAVALGGIGLTWLVWSAWYGANPVVSGRVSAFQVTSDTTVDAVLTVQRPDPSVPVRCTLAAKAVSYDIVGQLPVEVAASDQELEDIAVTLRTFKRATTVELQGCVPLP